MVVARGDLCRKLQGSADEWFEVILIDGDHSPDGRLDPKNSSFYTMEGLISAGQHLATGGVLAFWSYAESSPYTEAFHVVFGQVQVKPVTYDNQLIDEQLTDWLFFASEFKSPLMPVGD